VASKNRNARALLTFLFFNICTAVHNKTKSLVAPNFNNQTRLFHLQGFAQSRRDETHAKTRINHAQAHKPRLSAQAGAGEHLGNDDLGYLTI
jgi:hypothetical protein